MPRERTTNSIEAPTTEPKPISGHRLLAAQAAQSPEVDRKLAEQVRAAEELAEQGEIITPELLRTKLQLPGLQRATLIFNAYNEKSGRIVGDDAAPADNSGGAAETAHQVENSNEAEAGEQLLGDRAIAALDATEPAVSDQPQQQADEHQIEMVPPDSLQPHPLHGEVYGDTRNEGLLDSIRDHGIRYSLLVTNDNLIVSGRSRWLCASELDLPTVPVKRVSGDDLYIQQLILELNVQRQKTNEQKCREFGAHLRIEKERAKLRQGQRTDIRPNLATSEPGRARDLAAHKTGMKSTTAEKGLKVIETLDRLLKEGATKKAKDLRSELNKETIDAAYKLAKQEGWITSRTASPPAESKETASSSADSSTAQPLRTTAGANQTPDADGTEPEAARAIFEAEPPRCPEADPELEKTISEIPSSSTETLDPDTPGHDLTTSATETEGTETAVEETDFPPEDSDLLIGADIVAERLADHDSRAQSSSTYQGVFAALVLCVNRITAFEASDEVLDDLIHALREVREIVLELR